MLRCFIDRQGPRHARGPRTARILRNETEMQTTKETSVPRDGEAQLEGAECETQAGAAWMSGLQRAEATDSCLQGQCRQRKLRRNPPVPQTS